jgi:hypothetical protein
VIPDIDALDDWCERQEMRLLDELDLVDAPPPPREFVPEEYDVEVRR